MNKPITIAALVIILTALIYVLTRRPDQDSNSPRTPAENASAGAIRPGSSGTSSNDGPPSKSGSREPSRKRDTITTASGLQYKVLRPGSGPRPDANDSVTVHYHGTTLDGTVFDSSVERNKPATFALNRVIKGWTEGVQLMETGAKFRFIVPPELAYGRRGAGDKIGPNETLVFEVELLKVEPRP